MTVSAFWTVSPIAAQPPPERQLVPPERQQSPERKPVPPERQFAPPERQFAPPERQFAPAERRLVPPERPLVPPERQFAPPAWRRVPPEQQPPERQFAPPERQPPPERQLAPPERPFAPPDRQFAPPERPFAPPERQPPPERQLVPPERQRPRDQDQRPAAARPAPAAIVASLHARTGKTLLARVLGDYFALSGRPPLVFDTDITEQTLRASFPFDTIVVDLTETRDQMTLFDTLARRAPEARVVDVSHHAFRRFFKVMFESQFAAEAHLRDVAPIIFYVADRGIDAYEEARALRARFSDCAFVLVDNAVTGKVKDKTRRSAAYLEMQQHDLRMALPLFDFALADALDEDPALSLGDIVSQPLSRSNEASMPGDLPFDQRAALRSWVMQAFRDIHRLTRIIETRASALSPVANSEW